MKLPTSQEMKNLDKTAIEDYGIPGIVLMENAGLLTVLMMERELGPSKNSFVSIFIGPGNNGGDGLVIGRHLHQRGCHPIFFFLVNPDTLKGDAKKNLAIIKKLRLPFHVVDDESRAKTIPILIKQFESRRYRCYAIVDAIFGIGLTREITDHFALTVELINSRQFRGKTPVVSVDTPSGMHAETGKVLGACVRANYTATYCCPKPGHYIHGSSHWTGKLEIIDIGIPPEAISQANIRTELTTTTTLSRIIKPLRRKKASHKGDHGHLLILAGSAGKTGAAILCAKGALRSGAGLVTTAAPKALYPILASSFAESMTLPLSESDTFLSIDDWPCIQEGLKKKTAVVIGPGIGQNKATAALLLTIYNKVECPVIIDADGLNILAGLDKRLLAPAGPRIYTPHPGELSRLLDIPVEQIQGNRTEAAANGCSLFANQNHETILVLKGAGTIVATSNDSLHINTTGNPGMAAAGMGDVLCGMIGALLCQGLNPRDAAVAGVYLHGAAGDLLYERQGSGFYAGELADSIPEVIQKELDHQ